MNTLTLAEGALCELVTISNRRGLHARAAARFVKTLEGQQVQVLVQKDETTVSGHSIMGLMMLAAGPGTQLKLCAAGPDAPNVILALAELIANKFHEEE